MFSGMKIDETGHYVTFDNHSDDVAIDRPLACSVEDCPYEAGGSCHDCEEVFCDRHMVALSDDLLLCTSCANDRQCAATKIVDCGTEYRRRTDA